MAHLLVTPDKGMTKTMRKLTWVLPLLFLLPLTAEAQISGSAARRVISGSGAPDAAQCSLIGDTGKIYVRNDGGVAGSSLYVCGNSGVGAYSWEGPYPVTGTTAPGGATTQVQFNDAGAFGGDAGMVYNKTTDALTILGVLTASSLVTTGTAAAQTMTNIAAPGTPASGKSSFYVDSTTKIPSVKDDAGTIRTMVAPKFQISYILDPGATLADADDFNNFWINRSSAITITEICANVDAGTSVVNVQRNDGTAANILSGNLTGDTTLTACSTTFTASENSIAVGHALNFVMVTGAATGTPAKLTVTITYTKD